MYCGIRYDDSQLAGNACQKDIGFGGGVIWSFSSSDAHIDFEMIDGTFYDSSYFISVMPFFRIALNTREHA